MTFTSTPPTAPGFYAWRYREHKEPSAIEVGLTETRELYAVELCRLVKNMGGEWCRLVPAEEVARAYIEGMEDYSIDADKPAWDYSRAKQVAEGKI